MKIRHLILLIIFISISHHASSQRKTFIYGVVEPWEYEMVKYDKDPDAEAVVLFDIGKSYFEERNNSLELVFEQHRRIKILSVAGTDFAEIEIPYYRGKSITESVKEIRAITYNMTDGEVVRTSLDPSLAFDERINERWWVKKFVLPDVRPGSIIEYQYTLTSGDILGFRDWTFQDVIPTIYSEYETSMVPFYTYTFLLQGARKFDIEESYAGTGFKKQFASIEYNDMIYVHGMKDIPAFTDEEFISSKEDYLMKIDFQLSKFTRNDGVEFNVLTTWEELSKELLKNEAFGKFISKCESQASKLIDTKAYSTLSADDRIKAVTGYVRDNYKWNGSNDKMATKSAKEFISTKEGNAAEINLFLIGMLNAVGINTAPVLISTRSNGKIKSSVPFVESFNYVVACAALGTELVLLDGTTRFLPTEVIPPKCINGRGLIVTKEGETWCPVEFSELSTESREMNKSVDISDFSVNAEFKAGFDLFDGYTARQTWGDNRNSIEDYLTGKGYETNLESININNFNNADEPYTFTADVNLPAEKIGGKIYISPFLSEVRSENPFKASSRTYPIDIVYPYREIFESTINIPEGYEIDYIPEGKSYMNDAYGLSLDVRAVDNVVTIKLEYSLNKTIYDPSDYNRLKAFFNDVISTSAEKVVLKEQAESIQ